MSVVGKGSDVTFLRSTSVCSGPRAHALLGHRTRVPTARARLCGRVPKRILGRARLLECSKGKIGNYFLGRKSGQLEA